MDLFGNEMFEVESWFEREFWPLYPRKIARINALKKAKQVVQNEKVAQKVVDGVRRYIPEWGERKYIPYPATFLNQARWEDELTPTPDEADSQWQLLVKHFTRFGRYTDRVPPVNRTAMQVLAKMGGRNVICDAGPRTILQEKKRFLDLYHNCT